MIEFLRSVGRIDIQRGAWNLRCGIFAIVFAALVLTGCGEEPEQQHYEPLSPLPLRVSGSGAVTPTPLPATTPAPDGMPATQSAAAAPAPTETPLRTPAATPTTAVKHATPTPKSRGVTPTPKPQPSPTRKSPDPAPTEPSKPANPLSNGTLAGAVTQPAKAADSEPDDTSEEAEDELPVRLDDLTIEGLRVCAGVKDREPVGCEQSFTLAETRRVFTWMKVSDVKTPKVIKHVYFLEDRKIATVTLNLKYAAMRTWSQKTFKPDQAGNWKVVVMTTSDEVMAVRRWVVTP